MFSALLFSWFLSFGYVPQQADCVNGKISELESSRIATVAELGLSASFYRLDVYGSIENFQYIGDKGTFYPFRADYKIGAEFAITDNLKIIAEHECDHPVVCCPRGDLQSGFISSETKIVLKITGGSK